MGLDLVPTGKNPPEEINVIIEIPKDAEPVKYEVDKASGAIFVDRMLSTPMRYPCNYGYVPHTLCGDGDPADVLVILPLPLIPGSVIRVRPVGVLQMADEAGSDEKILAVPITKVFRGYAHINDIDDVPQHWLDRIGHFFEHYKDLEKGKWVKLERLGRCRRSQAGPRRVDRALQRDRGSGQAEVLSVTAHAPDAAAKAAARRPVVVSVCVQARDQRVVAVRRAAALRLRRLRAVGLHGALGRPWSAAR